MYTEQLTIFNNRVQYPIPRLPQKYLTEEGWWDDWHYTDEEQPTESNVYFTIRDCNGYYMYSYFYYSADEQKWYEADDWFKKWITPKINPFAWVGIPSKYLQVDKTLNARFEYEFDYKR